MPAYGDVLGEAPADAVDAASASYGDLGDDEVGTTAVLLLLANLSRLAIAREDGGGGPVTSGYFSPGAEMSHCGSGTAAVGARSAGRFKFEPNV